MKTLKAIPLVCLAAALLACSDSSVSRVPSEQEIEDGKERRLAAIEELNIPEEQKERMRQQIEGEVPEPTQGQERR
ncbi:MAG: hypothetical protein ACOCX1_03945 [Fimbriimonadaceae bacterium]